MRSRPEVRADLLEPFLDTVVTPEHQAAALTRLSKGGLAPAEVAGIRDKVAPIMLAYNAVLWEWHHLGLADLLYAAPAAPWVPEHQRIEPADKAVFFAWAMNIADLG
ncbi:hypothetical protein [Streptomyces sp. NPDC020362]|uniref:hypothetical protein n=1 Tax=unclassified Streptomyces TaxID=2593676 RepID=UPI0033C05AB2